MKTFTQIVADALVDCRDGGTLRTDARLDKLRPMLAKALKTRLEAEGYAIHDRQWCVRIPWQDRQPLGRVMTDDEQAKLGFASADVPE